MPPLLTAEKPFSQKVQKQHGFNTPFLITGKESRHRLLSFKRKELRSPFGIGRGSVHSGHRLSEPRTQMRTCSSSALFIRSFVLKSIIRCHPAEVNNLSNQTGRAFPAPFAYVLPDPSEARTSPSPQDKQPAILSHAPAFSARHARLQLGSS